MATQIPALPAGWKPFLDADGSQLGWQSPDLSTVVEVGAFQPPPAAPTTAAPQPNQALADALLGEASGQAVDVTPVPEDRRSVFPPVAQAPEIAPQMPEVPQVPPQAAQPMPDMSLANMPEPQPGQAMAAEMPDDDDDDLEVLQLQMKMRQSVPLDKGVDKRRGAPASVRAAVGAASTPQDRLTTIRKTYPDAQPYEDDNFIFADPKTKRPTLYNPPGLDFGDLPSIGPEIAESIGGTAGGLLTGALAPITAGTSIMAVPAGIGGGAAAGRELYQQLAKALLGTEDTRSLPHHLADTATTAGMNAVGARVGDLVGQGARGLFGPAVRNRLSAGGRQAIQDAQSLGVDLPIGAATGNRTIQTIEQGLFNTPGGAGPISNAYQNTVASVRDAADQLATRFGAKLQTKETVGGKIKAAAEGAADRFAARQKTLDAEIDRHIGASTPTAVNNVAAFRNQLAADLAAAPTSRKRALQAAIDRADEIIADAGGLTFETLRKIRTDLGRELDAPDVSGYLPAAEAALRKLYGAIREDIRAAADAAGPAARRALNVHDRYVRLNREVNLPVLQKIADQDLDIKAFNYAMQGAKDGGERLASLRRQFRPEEWDVIASSVLGRLGRAKPGQQGANELGEEVGDFSVATFLTNWNNLSPEAQNALWAGTRYAQLRDPLNTLVRVAERMVDSSKMANNSGTARSVGVALSGLTALNYLFTGGLGPAVTFTAFGLVGPNIAARLITNPGFVKWLAHSGAPGVMRNPNGLASHVARLTVVAEANPEIRDAIGQFVDALRAAPQEPASATAAPAAAQPAR